MAFEKTSSAPLPGSPLLTVPPTVPIVPTQAAPSLLTFAGILDALEADTEKTFLAKQAGLPIGAQTGLPALDARLGGALLPGLHIVHGSPGVGKTAFALQVAASCQTPALYLTCEMSPLELLRRHTARVTGTYLGRFKDGLMDGKTARALAVRGAQAAPWMAILDATSAPAPLFNSQTGWGLTDILALVRGLGGGTNTERPLLFVVDSLHSWADGLGIFAGDLSEYDRLNEALSALRGLAARENCAVLAVCERNRQSMKAGGQSAGAGTRKIEYGAETVLELQAGDDLQSSGPAQSVGVSVRISKNRNGAAGGDDIALRFCGALQTYTEDTF